MPRPKLQIPLDELELHAIRSAGPGGQNVNKVATAIQLRFDVVRSRSLSERVRARLLDIAGNRVSQEGVLVMTARRFRTQEANRRDVLDRLARLVHRAEQVPKRRVPTRPSRAAKRRRLDDKRRRGARKALRRSPRRED